MDNYNYTYSDTELDIILKKEFWKLLKAGLIIDARNGGLMLGPSIEQGGIDCVAETAAGFMKIGKIEGGVFIVNSLANKNYSEKLQAFNAYDVLFLEDEPVDYIISPTTCVYNTFGNDNKLVWLRGDEFIMNKYASFKFLKEIEEINYFDFRVWLLKGCRLQVTSCRLQG